MAKTTFFVEDIVPTKISTSTLITECAESEEAFRTNGSTSIDDLHQSWTSTKNLALFMCPDTLNNVDTYSGLSNCLLLYINEITDLKQEMLCSSRMPVSVSRMGEEILLTKAKRIKDSLSNLQQFVPGSVAASDPQFGQNLQRTAEAYRLAAMILLHESVSASPSVSKVVPPSKADSHAYLPLGSAVLDVDDKIAYIRSILTLVGQVLTQDAPNCSWPLWPLFIASCCAKTEEDKITALKLFETAQQKIKLGNIEPAFKVVQGVWQQRELQADEEVCPRTKKRRLQRKGRQHTASEEEQRFDGWYEWGRVMSMMGYQISLA
ncbi:hypothetical protein MMC17_002680 [Xylographa soralifera]|nr:hypothetical protein [Xylographa soralifera]